MEAADLRTAKAPKDAFPAETVSARRQHRILRRLQANGALEPLGWITLATSLATSGATHGATHSAFRSPTRSHSRSPSRSATICPAARVSALVIGTLSLCHPF